MEANAPGRVVRRIRNKLGVSQEGLARLLNATKGAIQHWERGRNNPDLARLNALRQLCPAGPERRELDSLIRQTQARVAPMAIFEPVKSVRKDGAGANGGPAPVGGSFVYLRRENHRLQHQVARLETLVKRRDERLKILENLATELQREMSKLRAGQPPLVASAPQPISMAKD